MQKNIRLSLLALALAALGVTASSALGGDMKPYKGFNMFPPATPPGGTAIFECWDNVGGRGIQVAQTTVDPPYPDGNTWIVTIHMLGTITYAGGAQLFDDCTLKLVYDATLQLALGVSMEGTATGGTGRFEGASGWVSGEVWFEEPIDLATVEPFRVWIEGQVSTVGSLQRAQPPTPMAD